MIQISKGFAVFILLTKLSKCFCNDLADMLPNQYASGIDGTL